MKLRFCDTRRRGVKLTETLAQQPIATLVVSDDSGPMRGLNGFRHSCPATGFDLRIELSQYRAEMPRLQYCPYCGMRVIVADRMAAGATQVEGLTVHSLARRWLGADAGTVIDCVSPEGAIDIRRASARWPLLDYQLEKLARIARRRHQRASNKQHSTGVDLRAVWYVRHVLTPPQTERRPEDPINGFVYAISNGSHIKIGWSARHPDLARLAGLQVGSPHDLKVVGALVRARGDERHIQSRFKEHWIRGEWFQDVPEIRAFFRNEFQESLRAVD